MNLIASQIRQLCPIFNGNVAGAAGFANAVADETFLRLPSAYVIPHGSDADENGSQTGDWQLVRERVAVIVVIETLMAGGQLDVADRRAQAAATSIDTYKYAIFKAILNWRPDWNPAQPFTADRESRGVYFIGEGFPEGAPPFDRARFFYQFIFGLDATITDDDGWQQPYDPLVDVRGTIVSEINQSETLAIVDVPLQGMP